MIILVVVTSVVPVMSTSTISFEVVPIVIYYDTEQYNMLLTDSNNSLNRRW